MISEIHKWITTLDEGTVFKLIIGVILTEFIWELYLNYRQHCVYKKHTVIPGALIGIMKKDTFEKARVYAADKSCFGMIRDIIVVVITLIFLSANGLVIMWDIGGLLMSKLGFAVENNEILQGAGFVLVLNTFSLVTKMPFSVYYTFVLEEKHGFNKQTAGFFIKDQIKSFLLGQILSVLLASAVTWIVIIGGKYFFLYLWVFAMAMTFFLMTIYPEVIAPLFDKYTPLPDGELRQQIEQMAANIEFPLKKLFVVEGSKRSSHSNAYFYGFYKNKRIVLFDTLLQDKKENEGKGCNDQEVLAVLGHELGHWKLNHTLKSIVIMQVNMLLVFVAFAALFRYQPIYSALGFRNSAPIIIGLMVLMQYVMTPYFLLLNWCMALLSRRHEFQADAFASSLGFRYSLKAALIKLNADNLSFPIYDSLYSSWQNSHPPLLERLEALEKQD